ncbi:transposase [Gemmata obscuriglobus]|uniref:transposase n=1 Tax=Gemmata obscuriglobus TaxID=114 RepID=UPI00016C356A|nr:transposase [Gemmata obscuriglobus]
MRRENPDKDVELWCEDELRLGLKPVARRVWALHGKRPTSSGRHRFESVFVYGFGHPTSGRSRFLVLPKANAVCMVQAPADFAGWADPGRRKVRVLIVDGSGGHTAKALVIPPNVVLHRLPPPRTPELQPAEHLWPLVREGVANRVFDTLEGLTATLTARCQRLTEHAAVVAGAVGLH